jgi:hypothetical protein
MHGALALSAGVLYVGRSAKTATVQAHDLDGRALGTCFEFRDEERGRSSVAGLDVDADHRVWVADDAAGKLRGFTLFGRPVVELGGSPADLSDVRGAPGSPVAVRARGSDDEFALLVASGGRRRYALQWFRPGDARVRALASLGDPEQSFDDLSDVHWSVGAGADGLERELVVACERRARRLQLFRDGRFVHAIALLGRPEAAARLADGRLVVALGDDAGHGNGGAGAVVLLAADGRVVRTLAGPGEVVHPSSIAVLPGDDDSETRLWVLDREGARVQLFTLDGRGWGAFPALAAR